MTSDDRYSDNDAIYDAVTEMYFLLSDITEILSRSYGKAIPRHISTSLNARLIGLANRLSVFLVPPMPEDYK